MDGWKELILSMGEQKEEEKRGEGFGKSRQNDRLFWKAAVFAA